MPIRLDDLSAIARAVLLRWVGRPDACPLSVPDIAIPIARERNGSALPGINELLDAALVERAEERLRLTEAGRAVLFGVPDRPELTLSRLIRERRHLLSDPDAMELARAEALAGETGYDVKTSLAVLRGMEPPRRDPDDPVGRWVDEFLGLPSAPGGVPGRLREAPGEPFE